MDEEQLSEEKRRNLIVFTKLYGYVKFFHPSSESEDFDWNSFASYGTREILKTGTREEFFETLRRLFIPIAPSVLIYSGGDNSGFDINKIIPPDTTDYKLIQWVHNGYGKDFGWEKEEYIYKSYIESSDSAEIQEMKIVEKDLGNGFKVKFPTTLYYKGKTFPSGNEESLTNLKKILFEESKLEFTCKDKAFPLANTIITWTVLEHFFPYFDVLDEINSGKVTKQEYWENVLRKSLSEAYGNSDKDEHKETLHKITAALRDGHGYVFEDETPKWSKPPLKIEWIENSAVVVKSDDDDKGITEGDVILEIDGRNINELVKESEEKYSASTDGHMKVFSVEMYLLKGKYESDITIKVRKPDGKELTKTLKRTVGLFPLKNFPYYDEFFEIETGVFYADLKQLSIERFLDKLNLLSDARGVIFDIRGYPKSDVRMVLQYLTETNLKSSKWLIPKITEPDLDNVEYVESTWDLPPLKPRIKGKVVFLTNTLAVSFAETIMAIVENYKLGTIIGTRTAGTNGNVANINLPGGFKITFTGMKVLKHDNSRFHGIGVIPDFEVNKTIKGVSEKRDEQFEKAIEFLKN